VYASAVRTEFQPVVSTGNGVALARAHVQRREPVGAAVNEHDVAALIGLAIQNSGDVKQDAGEQGATTGLGKVRDANSQITLEAAIAPAAMTDATRPPVR
jgi:hypothetical protein